MLLVTCYNILAVLLMLAEVQAQTGTRLITPCPDIFQYDPQNPNEPDRWYGTITLMSNDELTGVWLRLIFDKPIIQLVNWFGEVKIRGDTDYLVKNPMLMVAANTPYKVRFYVRYDPQETPPMLHSFRLNAKTVCQPIGGTTPPPPTSNQTWASEVRIPTTAPVSSNNFVPPSSQENRPSSSNQEDNDYFHGDFDKFNPSKPVIGLDNSACGTVVSAPRPLITQGQATHEAEFPWHAALYHVKGVGLTYICGASLVTRSHLITVAHCMTRTKSPQPLKPDRLHVYLGKYYLKRWSSPGIQEKDIDLITPHPNYNADSLKNDIAIIRLISPVEITNFVRPVCLWEGDPQLEAVINKAGTVVGWGFDETGKVTEELNKAEMPVVSQAMCIYSYPDFYSKFTSDGSFCAGFRNGTSVCNGDSGGGLVFPKATKTSRGGTIWQLRGLVSLSVALQNQLKCDASQYVVFTDVAKYLNWIKATLN